MDIFNIWIGDINLTALVLIISLVVVLPVQLLLCFKVKSRKIRSMPMTILFLSAAANLLMFAVTSGWKRLIFGYGALYMAIMMLMCAVGWTVWLVAKAREGVL